MKKFPPLIHVKIEELQNDPDYLAVLDDGVFGVDKPGERVAIYKLVEVGTVQITKRFVKRGQRA